MPTRDSVIENLHNSRYISKLDLTKAYFQIPLDKDSMKYCGVVTPYKGVRVNVKAAMGIPGSDCALEEIMCRVLGDMIQNGKAVKIADNLYCGSSTLEGLCQNWTELLTALTIICIYLLHRL